MLRITQFLLLVSPMILSAQSGLDTVGFLKNSYHEIALLGPSVNSDDDEVAPHRYATKLYFSKLAYPSTSGYHSGRAFATLEKGQAVPLEINPKEENVHLAYTALTVTGQRIYYTLYQQNLSGSTNKSQIWFRDKDFHGKWGSAKQMPRWFSQNGNKVSQPATGILRDSRSDILFFVSENDRGKGKQDLWACYVERDGSFSAPFNLPINSPEDEAAPFFDIGSQTLYFSSKGQQSYGGYDVFRSNYLGAGRWSRPENLGRPINSYYDDLFFTFNDNGHHCYFSSNRPNKKCPPADPSCRDFDIYKVNLKTTLQVFIFDDHDKLPLYGCNMELKDMATGDIISTYLNLKENFATVGLEPGKAYQLIISKQDYKAEFEDITADGMDLFKIAYLELRLQPLRAQAVRVSKVPTQPEETGVAQIVPEQSKVPLKVPDFAEQEMTIDTAFIAYTESLEKEDLPQAEDFLQKGGAGELPQAESIQEPPLSYVEKTANEAAITLEQESATQPYVAESPARYEEVSDKENSQFPEPKPTDYAVEPEEPSKQEDDQLLEQKREGESLTSIALETPSKAEGGQTLEDGKPDDVAGQYLQQTKLLFLSFDTANYRTVTNVPQIYLAKNEDPVDLLFFHKGLQCHVAFDFKTKDFRPDGMETMNRYLKSINGLLKKDQNPPMGITFFHGQESQFVVYSFQDGNAKTDEPSFIHTFLFPEHYRGVLPDPAAFIKLIVSGR